MNDVPIKPPALPVGGSVMAVVPQTFEELQRIANTIIGGGLAPTSLIRFAKAGEDPSIVSKQNVAAVSTVLMAGAELGLPPIAALRSFTVINGRPALYADGNVAVIRKARDTDGRKIAKSINRGFELVIDDDNNISDESFGWCASERADTGEVYREEFSIADAKIAGLWDAAETVRREVWAFDSSKGKRTPSMKDVANDSPWHRYWKKMLMWRATGYCLRWLYADILTGMVDEYEAREIEGYVDITPNATIQTSRASSFSPPEPPTDEAELHNSDQQDGGENEDSPSATVIDGKATPVAEASPPQDDKPADAPAEQVPLTGDVFDVPGFLEELEGDLALSADEDAAEAAWNEYSVEQTLYGDEASLAKAFEIKKAVLARLARPGEQAIIGEQKIAPEAKPEPTLPLGDVPPEPPADDDDIFPGDRPMQRPTK